MKFIRFGIAIMFLNLPLHGCKNNNKDAVPDRNQKSNELFELVASEELGMDRNLLNNMQQAITNGEYPNIHSVLVAKDKKLVFEAYFVGKDEIWGTDIGEIKHNKSLLHDVRSISKTIVSLCVGISLKRHEIDSVNQKVSDFFPEYEAHFEGEKSNLTVKHLLTMTSGLEWNEDVPYNDPRNSEIQMTESPDPIEFILSRPMATKPGEAWRYNGGTTQLLASIVQKVSGLSIEKYAEKHLFRPMGIQPYEWTRFPTIDLPSAASGLRLTSRDLLKFGILVSQNGKWQDDDIIPNDYMDDALTSHITFGRNNNVGYGYQFWILSAGTIFSGETHAIVAAFGNGDQRIYFDSTYDLIVIVTAGNYNNWNIKKDSESLLSDFIYPSFLQ